MVGALETNRLPDKDESLDSQKEFSDLKNQGYYEPVIGGPKKIQIPSGPDSKDQKKGKSQDEEEDQVPEQAGRPNGTDGIPHEDSQATEEARFDFTKIKEYMVLAQKLEKEVQSCLRGAHNIKRLNKKQKEISIDIANLIVANENPQKWLASIKEYVDNPKDKNAKRVTEIYKISQEHDIDFYLASLLLASKI